MSIDFNPDAPQNKVASPFDQKETRVEKVKALLQTRRSNVASRKGTRIEMQKDEEELEKEKDDLM